MCVGHVGRCTLRQSLREYPPFFIHILSISMLEDSNALPTELHMFHCGLNILASLFCFCFFAFPSPIRRKVSPICTNNSLTSVRDNPKEEADAALIHQGSLH